MVERLRGRKAPGPDLGGRPTRLPLYKLRPEWAQRGTPPTPTSTPVPMRMRLPMVKLPPWTTLICLHALLKSSKLNGSFWAIKSTGV
eukprot:8203101-Pyramimonas_sp.AAC.1